MLLGHIISLSSSSMSPSPSPPPTLLLLLSTCKLAGESGSSELSSKESVLFRLFLLWEDEEGKPNDGDEAEVVVLLMLLLNREFVPLWKWSLLFDKEAILPEGDCPPEMTPQSWQPAIVHPVGGGKWNGLLHPGGGDVNSVNNDDWVGGIGGGGGGAGAWAWGKAKW